MIDTLVLWDVDGTLLTTGRTGVAAWEDAVSEVLGIDADLARFPTSGLTDRMIARDLAVTFGEGADDAVEARLLDVYVARLPDRLDQSRGRVLPRVVEVVGALAATGRVGQLLLTGNARAGARAKLAAFGLADHFDGGGFCDDGFDRPTIGRACLRLAEARVGLIAPSRTYLVGDTPLDVACGHELGVRTIAVATGAHEAEELALHDPWLVVPALPAPAVLLDLLGLAP